MTSSFLIRPFEAARIPRCFEGAQIFSCPISGRSRRIPAASVPVTSEEAVSLPAGKTETIGFGLQATDVAIGTGGDAAQIELAPGGLSGGGAKTRITLTKS